MQVLLSSIGSRGDVQPLVALGIELTRRGHHARLCVPPNFKAWIEAYGLECVPIGPDVQKLAGGTTPGKPVLPSKEQLQQLAVQTVRGQFKVIPDAAQGCDLIVAATALQFAAGSVAENLRIPYVFVAYCPAVLPSPKYPPTKTGGFYPQGLPDETNLQLWKENETEFEKFGPTLNEERAKLGLASVESVQRAMFTARPWLAADPALAPAHPRDGLQVVQTGAWLVPDERELPAEVEDFLAAGTAPIYLGFGSNRTSDQAARILVEAARSLGLRSILQQGWANLAPQDSGGDCISVGDINYEKLFPRVAAVAHHGGAGTTTAAARAGRPQVIIPHHYDQFYWAYRVTEAGVGVSGPLRDDLSVDGLAQALRDCLQPEVAENARQLAMRMEARGVQIAAQRLIEEFA